MNLRIAFATTLLLAVPATAFPIGDAEAALAAVEAAREAVPQFDQARQADEAYLAEFEESYNKALRAFSDSVLALYEADAAHEAVPDLMSERWGIQAQRFDQADEAIAEITKVVAAHPDGALASSGRFWRANIAVNHRASTEAHHFAFDVAKGHVQTVLDAGDDEPERIAWLLRSLGDRAKEGSAEQLSLYTSLKKNYGETSSARGIDGTLYQLERIGKPFELTFEDAITGQSVSMASLHGKVVVVDFWATWCGPCVADMPHMKELYAKYADKGVEFVGVSLDAPVEEGGLEKLRAFVEARELPWHQYYQGNGWQSEFSTSWKIQSIPALFVVDASGNLASVNGRGRLEELLPELLAQREDATGTR